MFPQYQQYALNADRRVNRRVYHKELKKYSDETPVAFGDKGEIASEFYNRLQFSFINIISLLQEAQTLTYSTIVTITETPESAQKVGETGTPAKKRGRPREHKEEVVARSGNFFLTMAKINKELMILSKILKDNAPLFNYFNPSQFNTIDQGLGEILREVEKLENDVKGDFVKNSIEYKNSLEKIGEMRANLQSIITIFVKLLQTYTPLVTTVRRPLVFDAERVPAQNQYL